MSVIANYKLLMDIDSDESYTLELPVEQLDWSNGMADSYDTLADVTQLTATLSNQDGTLATQNFVDYPPAERVETFGAEKLTNPSFASDISSWSTFGNGTAKAVSSGQDHTGSGTGACSLYCTSNQFLNLYQVSMLSKFKSYNVTVVISYINGASLYIMPTPFGRTPGDATAYKIISATGTFTFRIDSLADSGIYLYIANPGFTTSEITIDSVSVEEIIVAYSDVPIDTSQITEIAGSQILSNPEFDNWTAGSPDNWTTTGTVKQVNSGQDHTGSGTGSINSFSNTIPGGLNTTVIQQTALKSVGRGLYRCEIKVSFLGTGTYISLGRLVIISAGTYVFYYQETPSSNSTAPLGNSIVCQNVAGAVDATIDYVRLYPTNVIQPPDNLPQIRRGMLCKVVVSYQELSQQLWIGKVTEFTPTPGQNGDRKIHLVCKDPMDKLREADFTPRFHTNETIDVLLEEMFKISPVVTFPHASDYWILGASGASELGLTTVLFDGAPTNFDVGSTTIPFSGDNSDRETVGTSDPKDLTKQGVSQIGFIRDCLAAEVDGRFFWDGRNSEFVFQNRHFDYLSDASEIFLNNFTSGNFVGSSDVFNDVTVHYQPRTLGSALSTLYQHNNEIHISKNSHVDLTIRYRDNTNPSARVGGQDMLQPVPGLDIIANSQSGGGGTDVTNSVHASVQFGGQSAKVTLLNDSANDVYVTTFRLRGTPITTFTPESVNVKDGTSMRLNDPQPLNYNANLISTRDDALDAANFFLARYKTSVRRFQSVTFLAQTSDQTMRNTINTGIGTRITVSDPFVKHEQDYTVVGERHSIDFTTWMHYVTWILKPNSNLNFWLLGSTEHSVLGVSTYPVF